MSKAAFSAAIVYRGEPIFTISRKGKTLAERMVDTLRAVEGIKDVLVLDRSGEQSPDIALACKKLGVKLHKASRRNPLSASFLAGALIQRSGVMLVPAAFPFVQSKFAQEAICKMKNENLDVLQFKDFPEGLAPTGVYRTGHLASTSISSLIDLFTGTRRAFSVRVRDKNARCGSMKWEDVVSQVPVRSFAVRSAEDIKNMVEVWPELETDDCGEMLLEDVFSATRLDTYLDWLSKSQKTSPTPHLVNEHLNDLERKFERTTLKSYPPYVCLNLTPMCNARCTFCTYDPKALERKEFISLDAVKQMTWLKYTSNFAIWGGIGDSLVHPQFSEMFSHVRETHPHLSISLFTNGISLTKDIADTLVGKLDTFNCSFNAASREVFLELMRVDKFEQVRENLRYLAQRRKETGATRPHLTASLVMTKESLSDIKPFVDLMYELGFDAVTFANFVSTTTVHKRDMDISSSLYLCKEEADAAVSSAIERGKELGMTINMPALFSETEGVNIVTGTRLKAPKWEKCTDPWRMCYLTVNDVGVPQMVFCCSGLYYDVDYDPEHLDEESLWKVWNHPAAQFFRKTTNHPGENAICTYCKTVDRFDPDNAFAVYDAYDQMKPIFESIAVKAETGSS